MKLTFFLLTACILNVAAKGVSQTVSFSGKDVPLEQLFSIVKEQTGYVFFYNERMLQGTRQVNIQANKMPLEDFLKQVFKNQPVTYTMQSKSISISRKPGASVDYNSLTKTEADKTLPENFLPVIGVVRSQDGQPLVGATISIKGGSTTVMTDKLGRFIINAQPGQLLIISYIGYEAKEVKAAAGAAINIVLVSKSNEIDSVNVVSTGYQKIPRYQLTGAASVLSEKDFNQRVAVTGNFMESLEGKIPGLVYDVQTDEISIRGIATFSAVKKPLVVVDGFPTEIDLHTINPNDIVSVSVLRDAAAAAIYGVRAANGVIVIETRRGKSGKVVFNLRATTAMQNKPDFSYLKYAPASEYVQLDNSRLVLGNQYTNLQVSNILGYSLTPIEKNYVALRASTITQAQADARLAEIGSYDNLQEYEDLFFQRRLTNNVNFDVSGGTERSTFVLGFNYVGDKLNNIRSKNEQYILNIANTYQLNKRMKLDFKGVYTNASSVSGNTPAYSTFYPYEKLADENGKPLPVALGTTMFMLGSTSGRSSNSNAVTDVKNATLLSSGLYDQFYYPYRELTSNTNTTKRSSTRFQARLNVKITDWLNMDIGGTYENQDSRIELLQKEDAFYTRLLLNITAQKDAITGRPVFSTVPQGDIVKRTFEKKSGYTVRGQLNLDKNFGNNDHHISAILGIEQRQLSTAGTITSLFGYDAQTLISKPLNMAAFNTFGNTSSFYPAVGNISIPHVSTDFYGETDALNRFMSYYGNATYMFKNRYIATGSIRLDQSNLFGSDPKYRNNPQWSAGLGWRIDQEGFAKGLHWLDNLKLRAAAGFTGNIPTSNGGKYLLLRSLLNTTFAVAETYYTVTSPENQSLRWETTRNQNIGIDYSILKNRISGSVDWYRKNSIDLFGNYDADPTSGFNSYNSNTASVINKGLEVLITSANFKRKHFAWTTQVTASFNQNEVTAIKTTVYSTSMSNAIASQNVVGRPMSAIFSYNYGGLTALGQPFVLDSKGEQKILNAPIVDVTINDMIYGGTTTPKYVLGLNNQFSVGAFDVSFLFMYYGGHVMRVEAPGSNPSFSANPLQGASNYWKNPGDEANTIIPRLPLGATSAAGYYAPGASYGYYYASQFVRKADFVRLRDLIVTYNIKAKLLEKAGLTQPQLRFQAQNIWRYTFSGNDIDPDAINRVSGLRTLPAQPMLSLSFFSKF